MAFSPNFDGTNKINSGNRDDAAVKIAAAKDFLEKTKNNKEFRSMDDYLTCKDIVDAL
jgi:hypothetical protein